MQEIGPVQLIVYKFDDVSRAQGKAIRELDAVRQKGTIRLLDGLIVHKQESGRVISLEDSDLTAEEALEFGALLGSLIGEAAGGEEGAIAGAIAGVEAVAENYYGISIADVREVAAELEPGTAAAMILIEHRWAAPFARAIRDAGGVPVVQGFLTKEAMFMVGEELRAVAEAQAAIEEAEAVKGLAMLDALTTVAEAEMIAETAIIEAEETVLMAESIKAAAAAEAVQALIAAEMIEEAAAQEALAALVAAELIEEEAYQRIEAATSEVTVLPLDQETDQ